jgi:hypothetical protein
MNVPVVRAPDASVPEQPVTAAVNCSKNLIAMRQIGGSRTHRRRQAARALRVPRLNGRRLPVISDEAGIAS